MIYKVTAKTSKGNLTVEVESDSKFKALDLVQHYFRAAFGDNFEMTWEENSDMYTIAHKVELENFVNALDTFDVDSQNISNEELEEMFNEFEDSLANDDTYSTIYNDTLCEILQKHGYIEED